MTTADFQEMMRTQLEYVGGLFPEQFCFDLLTTGQIDVATRLAILADSLELDPIDLDEVVYDAAAQFGADAANQTDDEDSQERSVEDAEASACDINNAGLPAQVAFLFLAHGTEAAAEQIIRNCV